MAYWVYILQCFKSNKFTNFYVGQTNDIEARMQEHYDNVRNKNTLPYTGRFDFVKLVWKKQCSSRSEAIAKERYIKSLSHADKRNLVFGN